MKCREFVEFLDDYLAGSLPDAVRRELDLHLTHCVNCTSYLQTYRETVRLARTVCSDPENPIPEEVPEELVRAILAAFARSDRS